MAAGSLGLRSFTDVLSLDPRPLSTPPDATDVVDVPGGSDAGDDATPAPATLVDPAIFLRRNLPRFVVLLPGVDGSARLGLSFVVSSAEHQGAATGVIVSVAGQARLRRDPRRLAAHRHEHRQRARVRLRPERPPSWRRSAHPAPARPGASPSTASPTAARHSSLAARTARASNSGTCGSASTTR